MLGVRARQIDLGADGTRRMSNHVTWQIAGVFAGVTRAGAVRLGGRPHGENPGPA
jgi:hypothetical protein